MPNQRYKWHRYLPTMSRRRRRNVPVIGSQKCPQCYSKRESKCPGYSGSGRA
jgi:hypothetical protein